MSISTSTSEIDFHRGNMLLGAARTYPNLKLTLVEGVQNALDAGADRILVCINLKNRTVIVADNGLGTDREKFEAALRSVGKTVKSKDKLGKFGLGLIAPLNKCTSFSFISTTTGRSGLHWTFRRSEIEKQDQQMSIPCREISRMPVIPKPFAQYVEGDFDVQWRTMVSMNGIVKDRIISIVDLDEFADTVSTSLGVGMRQNKATIRAVMVDDHDRMQVRDINPVVYTGEPLPIIVYESQADAGRVELELYRAPKSGGKRTGVVSVMALGDNYPITVKEFIRQARGRRAIDVIGDALNVLGSGYFEGIIRCENIVLAPERTKFEYNDALQMLYLTLDEWYDEYGHAQFKNEEVQSRETRWQDLGLKSQERLHDLLRTPTFARLLENLTSIVTVGRIGNGHQPPEKGKLDGLDDGPSVRVGQGGAGKQRTPRDASASHSPERQPRDRPGDVPFGAVGPSGQRRRLVTGDSQGLWFGHDDMPGNSKLWEFDTQRGVLWFNTRHPIWYRLDETKGRHQTKNEKWLMHLMEYLALEVLHLLAHFPDHSEFESHRDLVDDKIGHYVEAFIVSA